MTGLKKTKIIEQIIAKLGLKPLPDEGGYYRETYHSPIKVPLPLGNGNAQVQRELGSAIFYLVTPAEFSALHKIKSDEIFHFYLGDPVEMLQISENGESRKIILGPDILADQKVQALVSAGTWQGTKLVDGGEYALLGTTVVPGFDFADFVLGDKEHLSSQFPHLSGEIAKYTRN